MIIDIHNHLLVGVDDGPRSIDEMIELLRQAKRQGIEGIIVTPHHLHPRYQNEFPKVENLLKELKENPEVKQLSIDLYPGQEIRVTDDILTDIENKDIQGLHYSKYLLLELPSDHIPAFATRLIYEIQNKGFVPIIAHPERNKAIAKDIKTRSLAEGGSTITQQLAKNVYFTQKKEMTRKIAEIFMAFEFEKECTKEEIFELYINTIYFGDGYYCIYDASNGYFDKMPNEMNLYECTLLAGIPNAPSVYSPTVNPELAKQRQAQVLGKMIKYKFITQEMADKILNEM